MDTARISLVALFLAFAGHLAAQPLIYHKGVVNAASVMAPDLPGGAIAQGSIFSIYGTGLGPGMGVTVNAFPLETTFQGVSVKVFQGNVSVNALPIYVSATQINAIMPSNAPLGRTSVQVTYSGTSQFYGPSSNPAPVTIVPSSFGTFAANSGGVGPGVLQNFISSSSQPVNFSAQPAAPGQTVILWGTGLGPLNAPDDVAPPSGSLPVQVEVFVGGISASVGYSGRSPCCSGVDQIVFTVPQNAPLGCFVPVQVRVAGQVVSNAVTMAIQTGSGVCSDPNNPLEQNFLTGGNLGGLFPSRTNAILDQFVTQPTNILADSVLAILWKETGAPFAFDPIYSLPPEGACTVYAVAGDLLTDTDLPGLVPTGKSLDGGSPLKLSGAPGTASVPVTPPVYATVVGSNAAGAPAPNPLFNPGAFSATLPGGADVGPLQAHFTAAAPVTWTNQAQLVLVNRSQGLTFTWTGGDPERETVLIQGVSSNTPTHSSAEFVCAVSPSAGSFTVPAYVLANLPATASTDVLPKAWLFLGSIPLNGATAFSAQGLDAAFSVFGGWNAKSVVVQ